MKRSLPFNYMPGADWAKFIKSTRNRNPYPLVLEAISMLKETRGAALDLGCGAGVESKTLAKAGFHVEAVDLEPLAKKYLKNSAKIKVTIQDISRFKIQHDKYQIIVAWNSLPFLEKGWARRILKNIQEGLSMDGLVVLSIFGPEDSWNKTQNRVSSFSISEIKKVLQKIELVKTVEIKGRLKTVAGDNKLGHLIQLIGKKI